MNRQEQLQAITAALDALRVPYDDNMTQLLHETVHTPKSQVNIKLGKRWNAVRRSMATSDWQTLKTFINRVAGSGVENTK